MSTSTTTRRRKRQSKKNMENGPYAAMLKRMLRTYEARLGDSDPTDLVAALELSRQMDTLIGRAVRESRERYGFSWAEVGQHVGMSKQGAQQRWGKPKGGE